MWHLRSYQIGQKLPLAIVCATSYDIWHQNEGLKHKSWLIVGGHINTAQWTITYACVVSRETVRIALMIAAPNALEVKSANILHAYVHDTMTVKVWTMLVPEFGSGPFLTAVVVKALYCFKSARVLESVWWWLLWSLSNGVDESMVWYT